MRDIIVIGASAGGVEALKSLVKELPTSINAAIFVVVHFPPDATSVLPHILSRAGDLPAYHAHNGDSIKYGHIYIAPPDWHMLIEEDHVFLTRGPRENRHRPAIDTLFRAAAVAGGSRVIGVVLSGTMDDGTAGLQAIKLRGGVTICQDPREALYPDMPRNAIEQVRVDYVLSLHEIAQLLLQLTAQSEAEMANSPQPDPLERETEIAALQWDVFAQQEPPGDPSAYACPGCGGVLWEVHDGRLVRYRCRVGHAYSPIDLLESQENAVESALWSALRALEERASLLRRIAQRAQKQGHAYTAERFDRQEKEAAGRVALLHTVLQSGGLAALAAANVPPPSQTESLRKRYNPVPDCARVYVASINTAFPLRLSVANDRGEA